MRNILIFFYVLLGFTASSCANSQTFNSVQWGINKGSTPSPVCIMNGSACLGSIGNLNTSTGVFSIPFTQSGTNTVTSTVDQKLKQIVNAKDFGMKCDGSDETVIWNNIFGAYPNGIHLYIPRGICTFSAITVPDFYTITGENSSNTGMVTNSATLDAITLGNGDLIENVSFMSSVPKTAGTLVTMPKNASVIDNFICQYYYICISIKGTIASPAINNRVSNGIFRVPYTGPGSGAIFVANYGGTVLNSLQISGPGFPSLQPDYGISITQGDTLFLSNSNITLHGIALSIAPETNQSTFATQIVNSTFDGAGTNSSGPVSSCIIWPKVNGVVSETLMSNVWCGLSAQQDGLIVNTTGSASVNGLQIANSMFEGNAGSGIHVASANVSNMSVDNSLMCGNKLSGFYVSADAQHWSVTNSKLCSAYGRGPNLGIGMNISSSGTDYFVVSGNDLQGNTAGPLYDGSNGTHGFISSNPGYNPVGPNVISVGPSPFTVPVKHTESDIYIASGTVSNVAIAGLNVCSSAPCTVHAGANQQVVITYSVTPVVYQNQM